MNSVDDQYVHWDAAYVLGALSPAERFEYERHLSSCPQCRAAVADLAGMPGLLAQAAAAETSPPPPSSIVEDEPMPMFSPPDDLATTRGRQRRSWYGWLAAAAVILVIMSGLGGYLIRGAVDPAAAGGPQVSASAPFRLAFSPVAVTSMTAVVDLMPEGTQTGLRVECQYAPGAGAWSRYGIYVVDGSGQASLIKDWPAQPGKVMHPSGTADLPVTSIHSVEIRSMDDGKTLMTATVQ